MIDFRRNEEPLYQFRALSKNSERTQEGLVSKDARFDVRRLTGVLEDGAFQRAELIICFHKLFRASKVELHIIRAVN